MQQQQQQTQMIHMKMKVEATADTDVTVKEIKMDVEPQVNCNSLHTWQHLLKAIAVYTYRQNHHFSDRLKLELMQSYGVVYTLRQKDQKSRWKKNSDFGGTRKLGFYKQ